MHAPHIWSSRHTDGRLKIAVLLLAFIALVAAVSLSAIGRPDFSWAFTRAGSAPQVALVESQASTPVAIVATAEPKSTLPTPTPPRVAAVAVPTEITRGETASPTPAPTQEPTPEATETPMATATPLPVVVATATPTASPLPTPAPTASPTPAPTQEPTPTATAAPDPCDPWPEEIAAVIEVLFQEDVCLHWYVDISEVTDSYLKQRAEEYGWFAFGGYEVYYLPYEEERALPREKAHLQILMHEVCHVWQFRSMPLNTQGQPRFWYKTPQGASFLEATSSYQTADGKWVDGQGKPYATNPMEKAAQVCAVWINPGNTWAYDETNMPFTPEVLEWIEKWLPPKPP